MLPRQRDVTTSLLYWESTVQAELSIGVKLDYQPCSENDPALLPSLLGADQRAAEIEPTP